MFRKPKRKGIKDGLRRRSNEDDEKAIDQSSNLEEHEDDHGDADEETADLISQARKRLKGVSTTTTTTSATSTAQGGTTKDKSKAVALHTFDAKDSSSISNSDLATREALHLPSKEEQEALKSRPAAGRGADGIYRVDARQNKFLAGPIKASQNIRVTARFDYQPDICKDYKDTGFCGFGDTCIYLHDRGDTLTGWQLEAQWEEEQRKKKEKQEKELNEFMDAGKHPSNNNNNKQSSVFTTTDDADDGLPFACHLCREYFKDPIVTNCQHYFCQSCMMDHIRQGGGGGGATTADAACPICRKDTHGVFHEPTKLMAKKKRVLGSTQNNQSDSWKLFAEAFSAPSRKNDDEGG
ncbi:hypothetical protein ACA910_013256 [Epithemia clementina (nom. ined.)]